MNTENQLQISLAAARVNARLTQSQLGDYLGVSKSTINNWESGRTAPRPDQLKAICKLSGIPFDYIFLPVSLPKVETSA